MIRKVDTKTAVELFKRSYGDSTNRSLLIDDGSPSGWKESDIFPKIGDCELLIGDIQAPANLKSFLSLVRTYCLKKDETFYFLQEESVSGSEAIHVECDLISLDETIKFVNDAPNLNAVLFDASFTWALKFHHELFGYFSGEEEFCNLLRNTELANLVQEPVWL